MHPDPALQVTRTIPVFSYSFLVLAHLLLSFPLLRHTLQFLVPRKKRPGINDISLSYCPHLSLVSARPKTTYPIACNITVQLYLSCRPSDRMDSCWAHQDSSSVHASTLPSTPQTSAHVINVQISASLLRDTSICIAPLINLTGTCAARKKTLHWLSSCPCEF